MRRYETQFFFARHCRDFCDKKLIVFYFAGANNQADGRIWRPADGLKARSAHELSPESAVRAAKQYLEDNPSMTAERRKLRSWYESADSKPSVEMSHRLMSPEPTLPSSYYTHTDVYQPKGLSAASPYYKSRFDDNISYRRSYYDVGPEPYSTDSGPTSSTGGSSKFRVFQPKGLLKRRSRSVEKANLRSDSSEDLSPLGAYHNPYSTQTANPAASRAFSPVSDYYHTNYYDTSGAPRETPRGPPDIRKQPAKSILKKSTNFNSSLDEDSGYKSSKYSSEPDYYRDDYKLRTYAGTTSTPKPLTFVEKIKRHLSSEKLGPVSSSSSRRDEDSAPKIITGTRPTSYYSPHSTTDKDTSLDSLDNDKPRKKKSLLQLGRRRTTEIRYGNGASDSSGEELSRSKRPNSPLEKLKGFFSGTSGATKISSRSKEPTLPSISSRLDSTTTTTNPHTSSTGYGSTISNYTPNYRKTYQTSHRPHAYMPMTKYSWYEDSSLY